MLIRQLVFLGFHGRGWRWLSRSGTIAGMVIESARQLDDWCRSQAASQLDGADEAAKNHAVQCMVSVIWRHAHGQGLRLGDDWGWVLEMYGPDQFREIVEAAAESAAADRRRRRKRRGY